MFSTVPPEAFPGAATARPITALPFGLTPTMPEKPETLVLRSAGAQSPLRVVVYPPGKLSWGGGGQRKLSGTPG